MDAVMVTYKVKPDQIEANRQLVEAVLDELRQTQPDDTRYVIFQLDDGVTFVHLNWNEREDGNNTLTQLGAFERFQQDFAQRAQEGPVVSRLTEVGAFRVRDTR